MLFKHRERISFMCEFCIQNCNYDLLVSRNASFLNLLFSSPLLPPSPTEVESSYEKALAEEEERITCQRKMLLLSVKKIRERENEMLIQGKSCALRKRVEASEYELETMLRSIEKQVKSHSSFFMPHLLLSFFFVVENVCKVELNDFELQIDTDGEHLKFNFPL